MVAIKGLRYVVIDGFLFHGYNLWCCVTRWVGMSSNPEEVWKIGPGAAGTMEVDETVVAEDKCPPVAADNE
jgi:hypothetical protein